MAASSRITRAAAPRNTIRGAAISSVKTGNTTNGANEIPKKRTTPASDNPASSRKRKHNNPVKSEEKEDEENASDSELSDPPSDISSEFEKNEPVQPRPKRRAMRKPSSAKKQAPSKPDLAAGAAMAAELLPAKDESPSSQKPASGAKPKAKSKSNPYGLSPGESPYPEYPHPTSAECVEVNRILTSVHGRVTAPKTIPTPSLTSSGCGEVPSVLDALIRTRLSAATNGANSSRAFRGLVERFGVIQEGVGKGSVDWDAVRTAERGEVFEAIKSGGLAVVKSRDIQNILQMVHEENQTRRDELVKGEAASVQGVKHEHADEEQGEVAKADAAVLSLDHLHLLSSDEAFNKLIQYPGIGPKTASCVLLFCLQRPSFAVDTHVFRLTKWLGWVPRDKATRNSTYAHLDVRIPDELKYPLHYLFIKHGKTCGWCNAKAGAKDRAGKCPLAHLMVRSGAKAKAKPGSKGGKKGKKAVEGSEEEDEAEMSVEESPEEDEVSLKDDEEEEASVKDEEEEKDEDSEEEVHNVKVKRQTREKMKEES